MKRPLVAVVIVGALVAGGVAYKTGRLDGLVSKLPGGSAKADPDAGQPTTKSPVTKSPVLFKMPACAKWDSRQATGNIAQRKRLQANRALVRTAAASTAASIVKTGTAPSVAVVVGCGDDVITRVASGQAGANPARPDLTHYDTASVTKTFVAAGILKLAETGKLKLTDPVGKYLPAWSKGDKSKVTVLMLAQHRSGLASENPSEYVGVIKPGVDALATEQSIVNWKLAHKPGAFHYSNLGYVVLYQLGGVAAGQPGQFNRYMRSQLFEPLGMKNTVYLPGRERQAAPTVPYESTSTRLTGVARDQLVRKIGVTGHAGLFTTANDLGVFAAMLAGGGQSNGKRILSEASVKLMATAQQGSSYSAGAWTNSKSRWGGSMSKLTFGGFGDTGAAFSVDPVTGYWVVLLNNSSPTHGPKGEAKEAAIKAAIKSMNTAVMQAAKTAK